MERRREECVVRFYLGVFRGDLWGVGLVSVFFVSFFFFPWES